MTRADLVDWLKSEGCEQMPFLGNNVTGSAIKFYNPKTNTHVYIDTPIDDTKLPMYAIAHICGELGIKSPDCAINHAPMVKDIKQRFSPLFPPTKK